MAPFLSSSYSHPSISSISSTLLQSKCHHILPDCSLFYTSTWDRNDDGNLFLRQFILRYPGQWQLIPEAIVARASQWQHICQIQKNGSGGRSMMPEWLEGHFIRNMRHPSDCHTTATRLPLQSSEKSNTIANDCHTIATGKNRGNETCVGEEFGYYMSCDMPGPWDAECAVLYVNMQWQSLAIVGNRVVVVWQSSGNRTIPEMGT